MSEFEVVYNESVTVQERELRVGGYQLKERREWTDLGDGVTKIKHTRWINDRYGHYLILKRVAKF